jgi:hypothetical protein
MIRWILAVLFAFQPSEASAADRCGGARLTEASAEILVLVEQTGSEPPVTTHVSVSVLGLDAKMRYSGAYEETSEGRITPTQFVLYSSASTAITEPHRETIRWRRDDGDWRTFPHAYYADSRGEYEFKVAQKGPYKGLTWGTEHLDELKLGGRFTITRLSEAGEALVTGFIQYPNDAAINALYKRAKSQAIVGLKPGCKPTSFISPAPAK